VVRLRTIAGAGAGPAERGSVYVAVLVATMIVSVIGLSALKAMRSQQRASQGEADFVEAKFYAQSAIDMGLFDMSADSNWRNDYPNGNWWTDQPIAAGKYTLNVVDPADGNFKNGTSSDPVQLTGTGTKGNSKYLLQVTVQKQSGTMQVVAGTWKRVVLP
jgi:Tfp pilus assembly protein PilX